MQKLENLDVSLDAYQIDVSVKYVLDLFPRQTVKGLLVALLRTAHGKLHHPGSQEVAIVPTGGSLEHVAGNIGMSKDTFLRYIAVLRGIGLLHYVHNELHIPLGPYQPTGQAIRNLDQLIASAPRRKLQTLAAGVRDRYQVTFGFVAVPAGTQDEVKAILQDAQARLQKKRLSQIDRQVLCLQIVCLLALRCDSMPSVPFPEPSVLDESLRGDHSDLTTNTCGQVTLSSGEQDEREEPSEAQGKNLSDEVVQKKDLICSFLPPTVQVSLVETQHVNSLAGNPGRPFLPSQISKISQVSLLSAGEEDLPLAVSNSNSSHEEEIQERNSNSKQFDQQSSGSPCFTNEENVADETLDYLIALDGPQFADGAFMQSYLQTGEGQRHVNGMLNAIRSHPLTARRCAIHTLLLLYWPLERYGQVERPGAWFHSTLTRSLRKDHPFSLLPEAEMWTHTPYCLSELAELFSQERKRQEYDWQSGRGLYRPLPKGIAKRRRSGNEVSQVEPADFVETTQENPIEKGDPEQAKLRHEESVRQANQHARLSYHQAQDLAREVQQQAGKACLRIGLSKGEKAPDQVIVKVQLEGEKRPIVLQHAGQWERYWQWYQQGMRNGCFSSTGAQQGDPAKISVLARGV